MTFNWSFSSLDQYKICPFKYYCTRVSKKYVEPESDAMRWGNKVHTALEYTLKPPTEPLSDDLKETAKPYVKITDSLKLIPGEMFVELPLAIDRQFQVTEFRADNVWCRGKADIAIINNNDKVGCIFDWKTGGKDETAILNHKADQLELMCLLLTVVYPNIEIFKTGYIWLKHGRMTKFTFNKRELNWQRFLIDVMAMERSFANGYWPKKRNGLCRKHCPVLECQYNGRRG